LDVSAEVNTQGTAIPVGQDLEIPSRLCGFYSTEGVLLPWHRQVFSIVTSDLEEHARIWAAFVGLPSGMQKARAEAQTGCDPSAVAYGVPHLLEKFLVLGEHRYVGEESKVVARFHAIQMSAEIAGQ
jgi:hypothetical protein